MHASGISLSKRPNAVPSNSNGREKKKKQKKAEINKEDEKKNKIKEKKKRTQGPPLCQAAAHRSRDEPPPAPHSPPPAPRRPPPPRRLPGARPRHPLSPRRRRRCLLVRGDGGGGLCPMASGDGGDDAGVKRVADRYLKREVLGEGTYGVVFKAVDTKVHLIPSHHPPPPPTSPAPKTLTGAHRRARRGAR